MIRFGTTGEIVPVDQLTPGMVLDSLRGVDCQACGKVKRSGLAFCNRCYKRLPNARRDDLIRTMTEGFDRAFVAALRFLTAETPRRRDLNRDPGKPAEG